MPDMDGDRARFDMDPLRPGTGNQLSARQNLSRGPGKHMQELELDLCQQDRSTPTPDPSSAEVDHEVAKGDDAALLAEASIGSRPDRFWTRISIPGRCLVLLSCRTAGSWRACLRMNEEPQPQMPFDQREPFSVTGISFVPVAQCRFYGKVQALFGQRRVECLSVHRGNLDLKPFALQQRLPGRGEPAASAASSSGGKRFCRIILSVAHAQALFLLIARITSMSV